MTILNCIHICNLSFEVTFSRVNLWRGQLLFFFCLLLPTWTIRLARHEVLDFELQTNNFPLRDAFGFSLTFVCVRVDIWDSCFLSTSNGFHAKGFYAWSADDFFWGSEVTASENFYVYPEGTMKLLIAAVQLMQSFRISKQSASSVKFTMCACGKTRFFLIDYILNCGLQAANLFALAVTWSGFCLPSKLKHFHLGWLVP